MSEQSSPEPDPKPALRIVNPNATAEDVAALTVLFAAMGASEPAPGPGISNWAASARQGRRAPRPGPSAWRMANRPT